MQKLLLVLVSPFLFVWIAGCGTTTTKLATEQLLMSDAVDSAISRIDFRYLEGKKVFLDTSYLQKVKAVGVVNADYIISSLRQQLTAARCLIQLKKEEAEIIVEPRVGALGTDGHELTYGIPKTTALTSAAAVFSNTPIAPSVPEISLGRNVAQSGIAKIIVFAYDQDTKLPIWQSGIAKSESTSSSTWLLGAGPFQKGTIYDGVRFAGKQFGPGKQGVPKPDAAYDKVVYDSPHVFNNDQSNAVDEQLVERKPDSNVKQASHDEPDKK